MSKKVLFLLLLPALFVLNSCKKSEDTVNPEIHATVKGVVTIAGEAFASARVNMDNTRFQTTDQFGKFEFMNVSQGLHTLVITKDLDDGSYASYTNNVDINNNNADLGEIKLMKTMTLFVDTVSAANPVIKWSRSTDPTFRYYTLYKSSNSSFTDANGTGIYLAQKITDTVYTDNSAVKGKPVYYRVYGMHEGKYYGSAIEGAYAPPKNYILNGGFENYWNPSMPSNWNFTLQGINGFSYFKISKDNFKSGTSGLEIFWKDSLNYSHQATLYQRVQTGLLIPGRTYKFSFWAKSENGQIGASLIINEKPTFLSIPAGSGWTEKSVTFQMDQSIETMRIEIISSGDFDKYVKGWIDDMSLTVVR